MVALFRDSSVFENDDPVRHAHSGEPVRNQQSHLAFGQFGEPLENFVFGARVQRSRGFVQNQQLRIAKISASQRYFLPFAAGKIEPAFEAAAQQLVVAFRQSPDNRIGQTLLRGATNVVLRNRDRSGRPRCSGARSSHTA